MPLPYDSHRKVGDELSEVALGAMKSIRALIDSPAKQDEKLTAETAKIIAEAEQLYASVRKIDRETESLELDNYAKRLEIMRELQNLAADMDRQYWVEEMGNILPDAQ